MPYYRSVGVLPRKRHTQFRRPDGRLYTEELMGVAGFAADSALLYHRHRPTAISEAVAVTLDNRDMTPNVPLKPRHFATTRLPAAPLADADAVRGRQLLLGNSDVRMCVATASTPSPLYRNAVGDELLFVRLGSGTIETVFGALTVSAGDYVVLPASCTHRIVPDADSMTLFIVEASGHIGPPHRYLSERGQFLEHAPYCERDQRGPTEPLLAEGTDVEVYVRHRTGVTRYTYAHHPFDVVGWDGCLYPWAFNIRDFEPITGRVHQPPPVHQTFEGPRFVVCSFCPRKVDYHPMAVPVPYHHANVDSDEVLYYVGGQYAARRGSGIGLGSVSLHPAGFTHGPQPGAAEASLGVTEVDETAVMVDTFAPLELGPAALACEDAEYAWSWHRNDPATGLA